MTLRLLTCLVVLSAGVAHAAWSAPRPLNRERLAAAGLRIVETDHATLVTDAPPAPEVDVLPQLIDLALPQWGERFGVTPRRTDNWRLRVYLVEDEAKFRALGLWPDKSPEFQHGLSLGYETWVRQQSADYYRRHLLLHEATHSFMSTLLGSCGPGWYMEGMAELCGTHRWEPASRTLELSVMPRSRDEAADWGRVRLVRDAADAGEGLSVSAVMRIDNRVVMPAESYAWVWALCWFLDNHPAYRERFVGLPRLVNDPKFDDRFRAAYREDGKRLAQEWRLFTKTLTYGHDLSREAIDLQTGEPLAAGGSRRTTVQADRGWQSTGVAVQAGQPVAIAATGRFTIAHEPDGAPWPCEANGVTLRYHAGRPLGELLATVDDGPGALVEWSPVGLGADYTPPASGTLYLRVNDAANALADNEGALEITVGAE